METINADSPKETKEEARASSVKRRRSNELRLTARDRDIVRWVNEVGVATRPQVQKMFFGPGGRSRCQERLTLLVRKRYLDTLPGRRANSPAVYRVSRRTVNGRRLLRTEGVRVGRTRRVPAAMLAHKLDIVSCRVQIERACDETGISLLRWLDEEELVGLVARHGVIPDAYFQLSRPTAEGEKRSAFFLEVERSGKSERAMKEKLRRYGTFYYGGRFEQVVGSRALRVLMLIGAEYGIQPDRQIERLSAVTRDLGVTILRFATLRSFLELEPAVALRAEIWNKPGQDGEVSLLPKGQGNEGGGHDGPDE